MAKSKERINVPSVNEITKNLLRNKILPVYYLFGEDGYTLDNIVNVIKKAVEPEVLSDFDKEIVEPEKKQKLSQILDLAMSFPFGGGRKLVIINNFEKVDDKKELVNYVNSIPDFTILIICDYRKISTLSSEPYTTLLRKGFLYEVKNEKGEELVGWLLDRSQELKVVLSQEQARILMEITGEEKSLLEMQLQKLSAFVAGGKEITFDELKKLASPTRQYSIFDLQDALGKGDKSKSLEIAYSLLDSGQDIVMVINMLAKFILTIAQILELVRSNIDDNKGAQMMKVTWYYYVNCKKAHYFLSDNRLLNASRALLEADLMVKTSSVDNKNILLLLISTMLK